MNDNNDKKLSEDEKQIDELVDMIEGKMNGGVSRLLVSFSTAQDPGTKKEWYHHGRCDVRSPWANGTAPNCGDVDIRD